MTLIYPKRREFLASGVAALLYNSLVRSELAEACVGVATNPSNAPPQAAAVGYNTQTFGPGIKVSSTTQTSPVFVPTFGTPGSNWVPYAWTGTVFNNINWTQNSDGSVSMTGAGQAYGNGLSTGAPSLAQNTNPANRTVFNGTAFGGGFYAEAVMKSTSGGDMSFWMDDVETMNGRSIFALGGGITPGNPWPGQAVGYEDFNEVDIAEFDNVNVTGNTGAYAIHWENWYGPEPGNSQTDLGPTSPYNGFGYIPSTNLVPGSTFTLYQSYHKYGFLWVPASSSAQGYCKYYFDGAAISNTLHWNQYNPALGPPPVNGTTAGSIGDMLHYVLFLGAGDITGGTETSTATVQSVTVWQSGKGCNIYNV